jgi:hypothetical protein
MCGFNDVRQTVIHTAEPLVPESSAFAVDMAIEKPNIYKSLSINRIPADLIQAGERTVRSNIGLYKLINSVWNKEALPQQRKESFFYL